MRTARGFQVTEAFSLMFTAPHAPNPALPPGDPTDGLPEAARDALVAEAGQAIKIMRPYLASTLPAYPPQNPPGTPAGTLGVGELVGRIGNALKAAFPTSVWVAGTLLGFDKVANRPTKALGFTLADWDEVEAKPICQIDALMWRNVYEVVRAKFRQTGVELRDTLPVLMRVSVGMWAAQGKLQIYVEDADPSYTVGKILKNLDALHDRLIREGLAERNRSLPWPDVPLRIGLVTSPKDGFGDFTKILSQSGFPFVIHFAESRVQGPETVGSVTSALRRLAAEKVDCIAIVRGGGANADLSWFNDYTIARAICECPVPVIVGIGHDRDETLPDRIARSRSNPTAVAEALVKQVQALAADRVGRAGAVMSRVRGALGLEAAALRHRALQIDRSALRVLGTASARLGRHLMGIEAAARLPGKALALAQRKGDRLEFRVLSLLAQHRNRLLLDERALTLRAGQQTTRAAHRDIPLREHMLRRAAIRAIEKAAQKLESYERDLNARDPVKLLTRGYARLALTDGRIVRRVADLAPGADVRLRMADGTATATVREIDIKQPPQEEPR